MTLGSQGTTRWRPSCQRPLRRPVGREPHDRSDRGAASSEWPLLVSSIEGPCESVGPPRRVGPRRFAEMRGGFCHCRCAITHTAWCHRIVTCHRSPCARVRALRRRTSASGRRGTTWLTIRNRLGPDRPRLCGRPRPRGAVSMWRSSVSMATAGATPSCGIAVAGWSRCPRACRRGARRWLLTSTPRSTVPVSAADRRGSTPETRREIARAVQAGSPRDASPSGRPVKAGCGPRSPEMPRPRCACPGEHDGGVRASLLIQPLILHVARLVGLATYQHVMPGNGFPSIAGLSGSRIR